MFRQRQLSTKLIQSRIARKKSVRIRHGSATVTGSNVRSQTFSRCKPLRRDAFIPNGDLPMTAASSPQHPTMTIPAVLPATRVAVLLGFTVLLALLAYYFVGVDEGMSSIFGKTLVVHEWVHDARHFLGFPCH
jgi:hypothetical protein